MAEYTAIYDAGESVVNYLKSVMTPEPIAKKEHIGLCEPQSPEDYRLTVWIYSIEEEKNVGDGTLTGYYLDEENPKIERFAPMQLTLKMLISSHSKAPAIQKYADEYRIIGRAVQVMRDIPTIPAKFLNGTLAKSRIPVTTALLKLSTDEMFRIWNNTGMTIPPSFGIEVSQIFIDSERTRTASPRITEADFDVRQGVDPNRFYR